MARPEGVLRCASDGRALVLVEVLARSDGDPLLGMTVGGRYVILGKIGVGSWATVYAARDELGARDAAVKVFRRDRLLAERDLVRAHADQEARILQMLRCPHTVILYDTGEISLSDEDGLVQRESASFLAMEMLEGEPLSARLRREGRLDVASSVRFAEHALLSLAEAHERGIVHRDVKPDNLFLQRSANGGQEIGKLLDFGLACFVAEGPLHEPKGAVVGTPRTMSPEQARGEAIDARSDLYAVGVVLYQMLTGTAPFADADATRVMARHISELPVHPCLVAPEANIPRALGDLVIAALAKDAALRPASARTFLSVLGRFGAG